MSNDIQNVSWPGWEAVRLIGRGSFGAVYEIQRKVFKDTESAALKVISIPQNSSDIEEMYNDGYDEESITSTFQSHLESIVAEYSLMRKMNGSANIVNCEDVRYVQHDDGIGWDIFIKMELLTPLAKSLPEKIDDSTVIKIAKDMCAALELCKKHDIVHRDIKPQNIFVSPNGDYKLGDFGIAKVVEKTMGGTKIGTYKYMAPEVYNNQPYGASADIYSLGLVLYWLLNDRRMPFLPPAPEKLKAGMEETARNRRLNGEQIPAPVHGSESLRRIILKACAFELSNRYHSAAEMLHDLNTLSETIGIISDTESEDVDDIDEPSIDVTGNTDSQNSDSRIVPPAQEVIPDFSSGECRNTLIMTIALVTTWAFSVIFSFLALHNIQLYVPQIYESTSLWIYISLATGWCIPLVALLAVKGKTKSILGIDSKLICRIAVAIQLVVVVSDILFVFIQKSLQFVPGAVVLSETYWVLGSFLHEWTPFVISLLSLVLLVAKDCIALLVSSKCYPEAELTADIGSNELETNESNNQGQNLNIKAFIYKWLPLIIILLYLLFLLLDPITLIKRMFKDDLPQESNSTENTTELGSDDECNHMWVVVENNKFELATFRHIPVIFSDSTDDAKAEAHQKAQKIIAEWQAAGSTEDAFAQLHEQYSADLSAGDGGLVANASRNDLVDNIEAWLFDEPRNLGDLGLIETEAGYVLVYYVSTDVYSIDSVNPQYCSICHKTNGALLPIGNVSASQLGNYEPRESSLVAARWGGAVIDQKDQLWLWFEGTNTAIKTTVQDVAFIETDKLWGEKLVFIRHDGSVGYITIYTESQTYSDEINVEFPASVIDVIIFDYSILYALDGDGTLYECDLNHGGEAVKVDGVPALTQFQCIEGTSSPIFFGRGTDGNFYGWGYNGFGSFCDSERANIPTPVKLNIDNSLLDAQIFNSRIDGLCGFVFVGKDQTAAIYDAQGNVAATIADCSSIYTGESSVYVKSATGDLFVYGAHSSGKEINMGTDLFSFNGTLYCAEGFGAEIDRISSDGWSVAVMTNDGTIRCWGQERTDCYISNSEGQRFSVYSTD